MLAFVSDNPVVLNPTSTDKVIQGIVCAKHSTAGRLGKSVNHYTAVLLTCWHMTFSALATQVLARTTRWLDGRHEIQMTRRFYTRAIVPIALFYSASMVCSNIVYLYLNVAFIQMLKVSGDAPPNTR